MQKNKYENKVLKSYGDVKVDRITSVSLEEMRRDPCRVFKQKQESCPKQPQGELSSSAETRLQDRERFQQVPAAGRPQGEKK